jgi:general secretion pathway protein E
MLSELKDSETAKIAAHAALTGQLILGVVHANDSVGVLFRLIEFGVEPFLLSSTVIGTVAQRMIRRVCQHCARKLTAPSAEQTAFHRETGEKCSEFNYGAGCKACAHSGYLGRTSIFEVLTVTDEIRRLLTSGAKAPEVRAKAIEDGMLKARNGITTPHEVLRNVYWAA